MRKLTDRAAGSARGPKCMSFGALRRETAPGPPDGARDAEDDEGQAGPPRPIGRRGCATDGA